MNMAGEVWGAAGCLNAERFCMINEALRVRVNLDGAAINAEHGIKYAIAA